jgi:hypothetical protein
MKRILIVLMISTSLFSCNKEDNTINNGHKSYKPEGTIIADEPVMYTKNGIVNDKAIIKDYLTRREVLASYAIDQSISADKLSSYTFEFLSDSTVLRGNEHVDIISKTDNVMMLAALDSAVSVVGKKSITDSLMDMVNLNGPLAECPTYYTAPCMYRQKYPLQIKDGQYYIPYVVAAVSTNYPVPTIFGVPMDYTVFTFRRGESMFFNESMTTKPGGTVTYTDNNTTYTVDRQDTVVIQTMRQRMIKL